ncbi:hypothetical protein CEXT_424601 [Caerostris extrusa]|uniref:Uncharacterized protein n=1 Tax=Caerostris extrusa TaxID=172846 RepID=A0AAV4XIG9_CAEEX|nr:hypothetical protein CEXT_424601 [Caerostris extrusa]
MASNSQRAKTRDTSETRTTFPPRQQLTRQREQKDKKVEKKTTKEKSLVVNAVGEEERESVELICCQGHSPYNACSAIRNHALK